MVVSTSCDAEQDAEQDKHNAFRQNHPSHTVIDKSVFFNNPFPVGFVCSM
jgi:hypothetical protein